MPAQIYQAVAAQVSMITDRGVAVDYLTLVPDGEPALDTMLGDSIQALRGLGIPIAVISNRTLLWREDVRSRLPYADLVSVKVDSAVEDSWRRINLPHPDLAAHRAARHQGFCARLWWRLAHRHHAHCRSQR